jgi:hypothetical protein
MDVYMRPNRFHAFHADTIIAKGVLFKVFAGSPQYQA